MDIGEREERVGELRQYSVGRGIVGGDLAIREYLGREFYGSPVQSLEHIVVNLMKILRTTRRRVMEEILSYVRTKRTFVVPPSEDGFPGVLTIRKFADGRPDTLVFQGMNVETGEYVDPHDM